MKNHVFYNSLKKQIILFIIIMFSTQIQAQLEPNVLWIKQFGGTEDVVSFDIAKDYLDNIYITGYFKDTTNFGDITLTAPGSSAPFIAKTDPSGNVLWAKQFGGTGLDIGHGITTDTFGNVYTTGIFTGTVSFDSFTLNTSTKPTTFVVKQDTDGNVLWAKKFADVNEQEIVYAREIAIDTQNNVYTAGYFHSTADFGGIVLTKESNTGFNAFIVKQNDSGDVLWAKKIGDTGSVTTNKLATDSSDNIYITGYFSGTINLDGITSVNATPGYPKGFLLKLDTSGEVIWVKYFGEENHISSVGHTINVDNTGNVYLAGHFEGAFDFDSITIPNQSIKKFILKMNSNEEVLWIKTFDTTSTSGRFQNIVTDDIGNIYMVGGFNGTIYFDDIFVSISSLGQDAIVLKIENNGEVRWVDRFGSWSADLATGVTINSEDEISVVGNFRGDVLFFDTILSSQDQNTSTFIIKFVLENMSTDQNQISQLRTYPNPTRNILTINISDKDVNLSAEITNLLGQKIKTFKNINNTQNLDISDLSTGIYLLNLINQNGEKQTIKIKKI